MKLTIDSKVLIGLLHIAPKNDVRQHLNGIYCEVKGESVILVATDGRIMGALNCASAASFDEGESCEDTGFIIPRTLLESAKLSQKGVSIIELIHDDLGTKIRRVTLRDNHGATTVSGDEMDGKFPQWRRVIPKSPSGEITQFDPELPARLAAASKAINDIRRGGFVPVYIAHNGDSGALVSIGRDDFVGVLMGLNMRHVANLIPTAPPAWTM